MNDPRSRFTVLGPPILQAMLFGYAATYDLNQVRYAVYDQDHSEASRQFLADMDGSGTFRRVANLRDQRDIGALIDSRRVLIVVQIGQDFERRLLLGQPADVQVIADGRNSNTAGTALNYIGTIADSFNASWRQTHGAPPPPVEAVPRTWYNPNLETRWFMIPGFIGMLTMVQMVIITAMSVAREREQGTFDQLLVTPFRPIKIMIGKSVPSIIIGLAQQQSKEELAHYAKATVDLEYRFPGALGFSELEGIANRQDYDLSAHSRNIPEEDQRRLKLQANPDTTAKLDYFDEAAIDKATGKKGVRYVPYVIEPSAGADRATLAFLCEAYNEEIVKEPAPEVLIPLRESIAAACKNIEKKIGEAEKAAAKGEAFIPTAAQLQVIHSALKEAADRLPATLLDVEEACSLPGADHVELLKKIRPITAKLCDEYTRVVLKLHPKLAPIKVAVFPLKKNEPRIVEIARKIKHDLQPLFRTVYDDSAGIGKLYRRRTNRYAVLHHGRFRYPGRRKRGKLCCMERHGHPA